ncbi:MAG: hypothetical protein ACE5J4_03460 [Candidatus Aenigmatarchaeota archaeon]
MAIDIYDLVFEILQVTPTGDFQHDFIYLLFIPHIVILIWLFLIARGPAFAARNPGIGTLLAIGIYVFIVYMGWYSIIANLAIIWLIITIIVSFGYFMLPKFIHPGATRERFRLGKRIFGKATNIMDINEEIKHVKAELEHVKIQLKDPTLSSREKAVLQERRSLLSDKLDELKRAKKVI